MNNNMEILFQYLRKQYKKQKSNGWYRYYNSESTIRLNVTRISMVILMSLKCD